jgi:methyl-accepting chemotaxis protein
MKGFSFMKNSKITMKLLVSFGVTVLLISVVSLVSIFNLLGIDDNYSAVIVFHALPLNSAITVVGDIQAMRSETRNCVIFTGNKDRVRNSKVALDRLMREFEDSAASFSKTIVNPEVKGKYGEAMKQYNDIYKPGALKIVAEAEKGAPVAEMVAHLEMIKSASEIITDNMIYATDVKAGQLTSSSEEGTAQSRNIAAMMVILLIVGIIISGIVHFIYIANAIKVNSGTGKKIDRFHQAEKKENPFYYDLRRLAESGHAASQYLLGRAYEDGYFEGMPVEQDKAKAEYWFKKASEQGYTCR